MKSVLKGRFFNNNPYKKLLMGILFLLFFTCMIGLSYASWIYEYKQSDIDIIKTKCFELDLLNESEGITLEKVYPTSDEEGQKNEGYTFTIKNVCNTNAYYQVNLEELLKEKKLSNEYIKVSLNESNGKNLNTYEEVRTTIENTETSHKLTSGSLKPEESVTYNLKLWLDENTPATSEVMNASFESKISIVATYKEDLENVIEAEVTSLNKEYSKEKEILKAKVISEKYDLIEMSKDGVVYNAIDRTKEYNYEEEYREEGSYKVYFKDEMGNIKEVVLETKNLDQRAPEINIEESSIKNGALLNIELEDIKSGVVEYQVTDEKEEPESWIALSKKVRGSKHTVQIEVNENKIYYIWAKDYVGNIGVKEVEITKVDKLAPTLELTNKLTTWGEKEELLLKATDDYIGIKAYSITQEEGKYEWIEIEGSPLTFEKTIEITANGIYYVSIKDSYEHITTKTIEITKIDNKAPIIESVSGNPENWTNEDVTLVINGAVDQETRLHETPYSFDNGVTWQKENKKTYTENTSNIVIKVRDVLGNTYTHEGINITKIDKTKPIISNVTGNPTNWTNGNVTLTVNASDAGSGLHATAYSFDNGVTWQSSNVKTYTENTNNIVVKVRDIAGNVYTNAIINITKIDKAPPTITSVSGNPTSWTSGNVTLTVNGAKDDLSGLHATAYSFDGGVTWQSGNTKTYTGNTSNIMIKVRDSLGNIYTNSAINITKIDKTTPTVTLNGTTKSGVWTNANNTMSSTLNPSSILSGVSYKWYEVPEYKYTSTGFTVTEKEESNGSKYWNVAYSKTSGTENLWVNIEFPVYQYTVGKTYRIHYKIRVNSVSHMGIDVRHAAVNNDYGSDNKAITFNTVTNGWVEKSVDRVMPSSYTVGTTNYTTMSPRIEIYTSNLALTGGITEKSINFDFKDFWVEEIEPSAKATIANNLAVKLSDTVSSKVISATENKHYVVEVTTGSGNRATSNKFNTKVDKDAPTATKAEIKNLSSTGYDVYLYGVSDAGSGVNRIQFPTWTESGGQDDILSDWSTNSKATGVKQSDGTTWVFRVNTMDHKNEAGVYNTHIYLYDNYGNYRNVFSQKVTVPTVTITYDKNYLSNNLWTDSHLPSKYNAASTTPSSKVNVEDVSTMNGQVLKFIMNAGTSGGPYYSPSAKLTVGKQYSWSIYIKSNQNVSLNIGSEQGGRKVVNVTSSWQRVTHTFTANDSSYYAFVFYLNSGAWASGQELYVHSLEIREGALGNTSTVTKAYNNPLGTLETPTRSGYTFNGWFTAPVGGSKIDATTKVPSSNTTYYAHWSANKYYIDLNMNVDGTNYGTGYNNRVTVGVKINGIDKGYIQDYYTQHPTGTKWEIYGVKLDNVGVSYTASGVVGAGDIYPYINLHNLNINVNNTNYGSVSSSNLLVLKGGTYSVSGSTLTLQDGRKVTASVKNATGWTTTFNNFSPTSGTINAATTVTANFSRSDKTAPTISSVSGNPTSWTSGNVTLTVNASDAGIGLHATAYSFDNGANWQAGNTKTYTGNTSNIIVKVRDASGNIATASAINITKIDKTNPTAKVAASVSGSTITVKDDGSSDSQSGISKREYKLNDGTWYSGSTSYNFTNLANGSHTVYIRVTDGAGRVATASTSVTVSVTSTLLGGSINSGWNLSGWEWEKINTSYQWNGYKTNGTNLSAISVAKYNLANFRSLKVGTWFFGTGDCYSTLTIYICTSTTSCTSIASRNYNSSDSKTSQTITANISSYTGEYFIKLAVSQSGDVQTNVGSITLTY